MASTEIEWATHVWNPTTGCDRVSRGCDNCYALTMAARLKGMGQEKYQRDGDPRTSGPGFGVSVHPGELDAPLRWRKPRRVFVDSMGDLFHSEVPDEFIARVWAVMAATPQHTYQILTKRHGRMRSLLNDSPQRLLELLKDRLQPSRLYDAPWPLRNVWLGVSVEDQKAAELRIPALVDTPLAVRFLSCEPLLGPVDLRPWLDPWHRATRHSKTNPDHVLVPHRTPGQIRQFECQSCGFDTTRPGIDWVIAGGESGPNARPMHPYWARSLRDQCAAVGVPFFFKQWGAWAPASPGGWYSRTQWVAPGGAATPGDSQGGLREEVLMYAPRSKGLRELDGRTWDEVPDRAVI